MEKEGIDAIKGAYDFTPSGYFKPDAIIINSIYSQAKYLKDKSDNNHRRQKRFIENIRRGTF